MSNQAKAEVIPGAEFEKIEITDTKLNAKLEELNFVEINKATVNGEFAGFCVTVAPQGFGDKINMIRWESIDENIKNIKAVRDFIKIRKTFPCFNIGNRKKILNSVDGQIFDGVLQITYAYNGDVIILLFNPTNQKVLINLNGEYKLYANQLGILKDDDKVYTQVKIKPYSFLMLIK
jgi:hypothetical protein